MNRGQLIRAIYDNEDAWSCPEHNCNKPFEEDCAECCWECADRLLKAYEDEIRADTIDETFISLLDMFREGYDYPNQDIKDLCIALLEDAIETIRGV